MTQSSQLKRDQKQRNLPIYSATNNKTYISCNSLNGIITESQDHAQMRPDRSVMTFHRKCTALTVLATFVVIAVNVGVFKARTKPTSLSSPDSGVIRKTRTSSNISEFSSLYRNQSSLYLLSRLQLSDARTCTGDIITCQVFAVCGNTPGQIINCRCHHGYYFNNGQCQVCTLRCPPQHYLLSACSKTSNVNCAPCTVCDRTQYVAAPCNTHRDTICIDVSFPIGILPLDNSHLPDDGRQISLSHSSNVFLERLVHMDALETPMYVTNNQQSLDFVWPRISGLVIAVSVSEVYLLPDYHDVYAVDDTALFHRLMETSQKTQNYNNVQNNYCRHPLPDYYSIQLEVIANRTSTAQVIRCDSQDESVPRCPDSYKDGDRYVKWNINTPCASYMTSRLVPLKDGPNSVVCTDETELLRHVFHRARPTTQEYMFPSRECELHRRQCHQCLSSASCPAGSASHNDSYMEDNICCGIHCYSGSSCKRTFSSDCPPPVVECATGEVNIFSLFPHFDSMDTQFACHLKYVPAKQLYSISYILTIPGINFNTTPQHFTVVSPSRSHHERHLSQFDFITALHDARIKLEDELILLGTHSELKHHHQSLMKPYSVRELKTPSDLQKLKLDIRDGSSKAAYVQFEKPFLYSSMSWFKDGCNKNISQIYQNQTIYREDFTPIIARKSLREVDRPTGLYQAREFTYQIYHRDRSPYVKFFVEKGRSVLQHLQGTSARGKLVASSMYGKVTWHPETSKWILVFSAIQDDCPTVISLKIFTQMMTECAGHFDLLINCPLNFTMTFNFSAEISDLPDVFVLQINDSAASHNLVLPSIYSPLFVDQINVQHTGDLQKRPTNPKNSLLSIWLPLILIIILTIILLIVNCICFKHVISNGKKAELTLNKSSEGTTLSTQGKSVKDADVLSHSVYGKKCIIFIFVIVYILYSFVFTFSLGFSIIYLTQSSSWANITSPGHVGKELLSKVNKSLQDIQKFETGERTRLFSSVRERTQACLQHLTIQHKKLLLDYENMTRKQVDAIFVNNGFLHYYTNEIQKQNLSVYLQHVREFVSECNKTLNSIVDRFHANLYLFIRNTAHNDWLQVPRQIFLHQDEEDINVRYLSSTQVKQFASWLEVDKAEQLFATKENVFGRLSVIPLPQISDAEVTFPALRPHLDFSFKDIDTSSHSYTYTALGPSCYNNEDSVNSTSTVDELVTDMRFRRDSEAMLLRKNTHQGKAAFGYNSEDHDAIKIGSEKPKGYSGFEMNARYATKLQSLRNDDSRDEVDNDNIRVLGLDLMTNQEDTSTSKRVGDHLTLAESFKSPSDRVMDHPSIGNAFKSTSDRVIGQTPVLEAFKSPPKTESKETENFKLYILIATFLFVDIALWSYRLTWLRQSIYLVRHGYPEKIPTDEICKQLLEIQAVMLSPEEYSRYFTGGNDHILGCSKEPGITFLKDLTSSKFRADVFQKALNEKMAKEGYTDETRVRTTGKFGNVQKVVRQTFLSHLVWQGCVTFIVITLICVLVYCVELWLSPDHFRALLGCKSAVEDVQWQLDSSTRYLRELARQLTIKLQLMKELCDSEVKTMTEVFFATVNMQTSTFGAILQQLCQQAKGRNCDKLLANQLIGERIVGCNFLPLQVYTFHDFSLSHVEAMVASEVIPLINRSHHMLMVSASVAVLLLCCRLLCQVTASTVRHHLLLTGCLPRLRVYQSEKAPITSAERNCSTMQRSQSWVDSCESGVYLGEADDLNKDENR